MQAHRAALTTAARDEALFEQATYPLIVGKIRDATHNMALALLVLAASLPAAGLLTLYVTRGKPGQK